MSWQALSFVLPCTARNGHHLTVYEKLVLVILADCHNLATGRLNPSLKFIAERSCQSIRQVIRALQILETYGFITILKHHRISNNYIINNLDTYIRSLSTETSLNPNSRFSLRVGVPNSHPNRVPNSHPRQNEPDFNELPMSYGVPLGENRPQAIVSYDENGDMDEVTLEKSIWHTENAQVHDNDREEQ
jgi:Helix-turn-helix domain